MDKLFLTVLIISFIGLIANSPIKFEDSIEDIPESQQTDEDSGLDGGSLGTRSVVISQENSYGIVKRDIQDSDSSVSSSGEVALSDIIENIESSLFNSALGASDIYQKYAKRYSDESISSESNQSADKLNQSDESDVSLAKRQTNNSAENSTDNQQQEPTEIRSKLTAHELPPSDSDDQPRLAFDRITVYVANDDNLPFIPSFHLDTNGETHDLIQDIIDSKTNSTSSSEADDNDSVGTTTEIENVDDKNVSSTTAPLTSKTSTENLKEKKEELEEKKEELKEKEEDLKEKIAEIQADPIILTARV